MASGVRWKQTLQTLNLTAADMLDLPDPAEVRRNSQVYGRPSSRRCTGHSLELQHGRKHVNLGALLVAARRKRPLALLSIFLKRSGAIWNGSRRDLVG